MVDGSTPCRSFHDIMCDNAERFGSREYIVSVDQRKRITFDQMNRICNRVSNYLRSEGIEKDDRITLIGQNSLEALVIFFSVLKYGAIINPLNSEESKENISRLVKRVNPRLLFFDQRFPFDDSHASPGRVPFSDFDGQATGKDDLFTLIRDCDDVFENPLGGQEDIAVIYFTSGTTEVPKGVVVSRNGLLHMAAEVIEKMGFTERDRILEYRAYTWASPQTLTIVPSLVAGSTLILARKFSRSRFPDWLKANDVTISSGVPTVFNILVSEPVELKKKDVPSLKFITSSSAPLTLETLNKFEEIYGIPINQMAGMSEAGWMLGNPPDRRKPGSVGTPFLYKRIEIVNLEGRKCETGEEGEILVNGKSLALGYLNEKGGVDRFLNQSFPTGDLGYMDDEGYVFITGRKKDLIIRGGVNISPMEISDRLNEHPGVKESVVFGVPDKIYGEEVAAVVVLQQGSTLCEEEMIRHCRETLPDFKVPKKIRISEEIPRTKTGKVAKPALLSLIGPMSK